MQNLKVKKTYVDDLKKLFISVILILIYKKIYDIKNVRKIIDSYWKFEIKQPVFSAEMNKVLNDEERVSIKERLINLFQ